MGVIIIAARPIKKNALQGKKRRKPLILKEKVSTFFELPDEILLNTPKMHMTGNKRLLVENYKGILEFNRERITLSTSNSPIVVNGTGLHIKEITLEDIFIMGHIVSLEFKQKD